MRSPLRAIMRAVLYGIWTALLLPIQMLAVMLRLDIAKRLPRFYHRVCCRILGIDVQCRGEPSRDHPVLFVANHTSYLDIEILGSLIAGSFVAKAEVANWPFFGLLAKLQRTVFIDRRGSKAALHRDEIGARLEAGDDLILFPEGTSGDGNRVLPFKSALFSVAERRVAGRPIVVQPVSVAYSHIDGLPIGREWRPYFAWYGDMDLGDHIRNVISMGRLTIQVVFHPPLSTAEMAAMQGTPSALRKLMADRSYAAVVEGHAQALFATGRHSFSPPTGTPARPKLGRAPAAAAEQPQPRPT
jgi:1-acyl-sn-glycerol-3-phosphate acyltransferase